MAMTEQIRIMLVKSGNISESELARRLGISPQNLHNKMKRDNFTESDLREIANALNCNLKIQFISKETGNIMDKDTKGRPRNGLLTTNKG